MYRIPAVYRPDNYHGRVKLAASYIAQDKGGTRTFDTCFEMDDGAAVAVALYRRAQENPNGPLAKKTCCDKRPPVACAGIEGCTRE